MEETNQNTDQNKEEKSFDYNHHDHHHHHSYRHCRCSDYHKGINFGTVFLGALLVLLGLIYLGKTTGYLDISLSFNWTEVYAVILIFIGLSMISGRGLISAVIGLIIALIILGLFFRFLFGPIYFNHMDRMDGFQIPQTSQNMMNIN